MKLFFGDSVVVPEPKQLIGLGDIGFEGDTIPDNVFQGYVHFTSCTPGECKCDEEMARWDRASDLTEMTGYDSVDEIGLNAGWFGDNF